MIQIQDRILANRDVRVPNEIEIGRVTRPMTDPMSDPIRATISIQKLMAIVKFLHA